VYKSATQQKPNKVVVADNIKETRLRHEAEVDKEKTILGLYETSEIL
jgi:hypothetical protein